MICPTFRVQGFCDIANCPHLHPTFTCDICGVMCRSQEYYNNHLASRKHATAKLANSRKRDYVPMKCTLCDAQLGGPASVGQHINGRAHAVRLSELQQQGRHVDLSQVIVEDRESLFECTVCKITVWRQNRVQHERTSRHRQKERFAAFKATLDEAERDKYGVSVTPSGKDAFDFGIIDPGRATRNFFLSLDNTRSGVLFRSATITSSARYQSR
jgi:helicase MOV-10